MAIVNVGLNPGYASGRLFSWISDLVQKIKDILTPNVPELVPIPVPVRPAGPPRKRS